MTKIDIFSGFLGAGKTTLIKKLLKEAYAGELCVLIENEFGEIGIDGGFLKEAGIQITEMNSGCICCSLVGDFNKALCEVIEKYHPDRILIEPSGVGKLSDVIRAVQKVESDDVKLGSLITVVDAGKCRIYSKNFGEFFNNQIESAGTVVLSHTGGMSEEKLAQALDIVRDHNKKASVITTNWDDIPGEKIKDTAENRDSLEEELKKLREMPEDEHHHHHHDDHDDDEHDEHHHHHHDDHDDDDHDEHHHHHHDDHDDDHDEHHHHHHHDHDDDHDEHHHHHHDHDHHDHDADEIFDSFGAETVKKFDPDRLKECLEALDSGEYGMILRAKGIVESSDGRWIHFDYVPEEADVRFGSAEVTGRICIIGSEVNEEKLRELFGI